MKTIVNEINDEKTTKTDNKAQACKRLRNATHDLETLIKHFSDPTYNQRQTNVIRRIKRDVQESIRILETK